MMINGGRYVWFRFHDATICCNYVKVKWNFDFYYSELLCN